MHGSLWVLLRMVFSPEGAPIDCQQKQPHSCLHTRGLTLTMVTGFLMMDAGDTLA